MPDRTIFVGQASLRRAVIEYMEHYHAERNHQGLENRLIYVPASQCGKGQATPDRPSPEHQRRGFCAKQDSIAIVHPHAHGSTADSVGVGFVTYPAMN